MCPWACVYVQVKVGAFVMGLWAKDWGMNTGTSAEARGFAGRAGKARLGLRHYLPKAQFNCSCFPGRAMGLQWS